jgi:hypothetical protein
VGHVPSLILGKICYEKKRRRRRRRKRSIGMLKA